MKIHPTESNWKCFWYSSFRIIAHQKTKNYLENDVAKYHLKWNGFLDWNFRWNIFTSHCLIIIFLREIQETIQFFIKIFKKAQNSLNLSFRNIAHPSWTRPKVRQRCLWMFCLAYSQFWNKLFTTYHPSFQSTKQLDG